MTLTLWEIAAREFEPNQYLWVNGTWAATVDPADCLRVDGPSGSLTYVITGVDLAGLR